MDEREPGAKESELKGGLNNLGAAANDVCALSKELTGKLSPVMREIQSPPTVEAKTQPACSPIGQQIEVIRNTVNETGDRLQEIMRHLEV